MTTLDWLGRCIERTGHGDGKGQVSFNKSVTFTALLVWAGEVAAVCAIAWLTKTYPPAALMAVLSAQGGFTIGAGFGLKGLAMVAKQRAEALTITETGSTTSQLDAAAIIRAVREKHPADGGEHRERER